MAHRIKILFMTCFGDLHGGGQRSLCLLLKHLDRHAFEPVLMVPEDGALRREAEALGVKVYVHSLPKIRSFSFISAGRQLGRLIRFVRENRIDLLCTDSVRETIYAGLAGKRARVPVLLHLRVTDSGRWVDRILYRLTDRMIAVSQATAGRFTGIDRDKKIDVVYNGIDLDLLRPVATGGGLPVKIGYFGRVEHRKGLDIFIKALHLLNDRRLEGHIFGQGERATIEGLKKLTGPGHVVFHGYLEDATPAMAEMDAVILPSRYGEGLSRSIIEAFALGKPVIVSDAPSNPEAVGEELREFVFTGEDPRDLARVLTRILDDRTLLEKASGRARLRAEEYFDIRKNTRAIERIYEELAGVKKILIVNLGGVGDVLLSIPALRALRNFYPGASLTLLAVGRVCGFAGEFHLFDEMLSWDGFDEAHRRFSFFHSKRMFAKLALLRHRRFDWAVNMRTIVSRLSSLKMAALFLAIGARRCAGRDTDGRGFFFDVKIPEPLVGLKHEMEYNLEMAAALGADVSDRSFPLTVPPGIREKVERELVRDSVGAGDFLIGIHAGGMLSRRWPIAFYAEAIKKIQERISCRIVLTGGPGEENLYDALTRAGVSSVINRINRLSWAELVSLIGRCRLFISNDTGPMHVAAILGVPLVAIFGGGYLMRFDPRKISSRTVVLSRQTACAPCVRVECPSLACLKGIIPDDVVAAVLQLWEDKA